MLVALIEDLQKTQARIAKLQSEIADEKTAALRSLPARYGFADVEALARAVRQAALGRRPAKVRGQPSAPPLPTPAGVARKMSARAADAAPAAPRPTGTSLDDPANFGLLPDAAVLDQGLLDTPAFRSRLLTALSFAGQVLHTSKVPARVWREWREFERKASERLRALTG